MTLASTSVEPTLPRRRGRCRRRFSSCSPATRPGSAVTDVPVGDCDPFGARPAVGAVCLLRAALSRLCRRRSRLGVEPAAAGAAGGLGTAFMSTRSAATSATSVLTTPRPPRWTRCRWSPSTGMGPSYYLRDDGTWDQMREYFVHRSLYHLKEADPHALAIPRLVGHAKAAFVAVEFDEYGGGRGEHMHQKLFADLMAAAGLDNSLPRLSRRRARRDTGRGEPDVLLRTASIDARRGHRSFRCDGDHVVTRVAPARGRAAADGCTAGLCRVLPRARRGRRGARAGGAQRRRGRSGGPGAAFGSHVVFGIRARDIVENRLADHIMARWIAGADFA